MTEESDGEKIHDGEDAQNSQIQNTSREQVSCVWTATGFFTKVSALQDMFQVICSARRNTWREKIELVGRYL